MRTTSRMILGLCLAVLAAGCGAKPSPSSEANVPITPGTNTDQTPNVQAKAVHELDPTRHVMPTSPLSGSLGGTEVSPTVSLEEEYLVFRVMKPGTKDAERVVKLKVRPDVGQPLPQGKRIIRQDQPPGADVPTVEMTVPGKPTYLFPNGYAMTLELEPRKGGQLPGKIYLCLPDEEKSFLAGTFTATAPRLPIEPPDVDDVPLINGSVTVTGAAPGAVLVTGYAASPNGMTSQVGIAAVDIELAESAGGLKWATLDHDKPRVTSLIAGDGKKTPSRFEHSKLTPGRYLAFAQLKDGPAAWKWVDVAEKSTVKADLSIDATKVGGVEVTAPLGSLSKMQMAPADEPHRPPLDATLFELIALQLKLERDIVARKALFKNLAPGRYEVRDKASGQIRVVEIVAGKTVELDFDAKPLPTKPDPAPMPKSKG